MVQLRAGYQWRSGMKLRICGALLAAVSAYGQMPGYGGPGVASRGAQAGNRGTEPVSIRPYANVMGFVDNGMLGVGLTETGELVNPGAMYGVEAGIGAYGSKSWRRSQVGLDYQGNYRHYTKNTFFNGSDHILGLNYTTQATRRVSYQLGVFAGVTSRTVGGNFINGLLAPQFLGTTQFDVFDNRAYFLNATGQTTIQVGARNYVSLSGSGFAVRRRSSALVGLNGQLASGSFGRQVNRKTTLGVQYQYFHVDYPRVFGEADSMMLALQVSRQIGRLWNLTLSAGAIRTDFSGVRVVTVDPVVAELFGVTTGREAFNSINTVPQTTISVSRGLRRGSFSMSYSRGVNPGNGALLLSRQETMGGAYSYNTANKWSFSVTTNYSRFNGLGNYNDRLNFLMGGVIASRQLTDDVHFVSGFDVRRADVSSAVFQRVSTRFSVGFAYSPGELPLSLR